MADTGCVSFWYARNKLIETTDAATITKTKKFILVSSVTKLITGGDVCNDQFKYLPKTTKLK